MTDFPPLPQTSRGRKGPPVVLIHGFGGDRLAWAGLTGPLSRHRRTIAVDLPGHGAAAEWPEPVDARVCATALAASLDAMGIGSATLVGHSMGGAVAAIVGLARPELVERLVLLSPGGFGREINVPLLKRYALMQTPDEIAPVLDEFFGLDAVIPPQLPRLVAEQREDAGLRRSFAAIVEAITKGDGQGVLPLDRLAELPFPVSVLWGLEDRVVPAAQGIAAPAAFARHLLPGVGHMPHMEAPDLVLDILVKTICGRA
jgi:pyruvate dehydrogenase E2 component (dihydrolipoamide acetyltransferase)